jgi:hypothetical protein
MPLLEGMSSGKSEACRKALTASYHLVPLSCGIVDIVRDECIGEEVSGSSGVAGKESGTLPPLQGLSDTDSTPADGVNHGTDRWLQCFHSHDCYRRIRFHQWNRTMLLSRYGHGRLRDCRMLGWRRNFVAPRTTTLGFRCLF